MCRGQAPRLASSFTDTKDTVMGDKRLQKQIDKLEDTADQLASAADELRERAASKASKLSDAATTRAADLLDIDLEPEKKKGRKGVVALVLAGLGGAAFAMKKKRDQELDEALWEEPRAM